jgi:hypothetical protein
MYNVYICFLFTTLLFFVLTPGIVLTLPPNSSKTIVALVHGLVFSTVWYFTYKLLLDASEKRPTRTM